MQDTSSSLVKLPKLARTRTNHVVNYNFKNLSRLLQGNASDEDIVLEAIEVGYLLYPSKDFIWKIYEKQLDFDPIKSQKPVKNYRSRYYQEELMTNDYTTIKFLNLYKIPIIEIGDICLCQNLRILNLSNNYLINIESLSICINLIRLDLQNNQIINLPDQYFWTHMKKLRILFLHNNPVGKLEFLGFLSKCDNLEILTLYDTPLSLKNNYRHHTVNSIQSLKALDNYVISDEEIIEEARLGSSFGTKSPYFRINLIIPQAQENTYKSELQATFGLIKMVNKILSHYSPVLIIQKNIRGFIARKKFHQQKRKKINDSAIKIQRWWRKKRKLVQKKSNQPIREVRNQDFDAIKIQTTSYNLSEAKIELLKEEWLKNKIKSEHSLTRAPINTPNTNYKKRNIFIDLNKLDKRNPSYLESLSTVSMKDIPKPNLPKSRSEKASELSKSYRPTDDNLQDFFKNNNIDSIRLIEISKIISMFNQTYDSEHLTKNLSNDEINNQIKNFLQKATKKNVYNKPGFKEPHLDINFEDESGVESDEEQLRNEAITFRLPTLRPNNTIMKSKDELVLDMVKEKYVGFNSVKQIEVEAHKQMKILKETIPFTAKNQFLTNDQRFFQKIYGNMSFGSLFAVDTAYQERNMADKLSMRKKKAEIIREEKRNSRQQIEYFKSDHVREAKKNLSQQFELLEMSKRKSQDEFIQLQQAVKDKKDRDEEVRRKRKRNLFLAIDFSKQHLSVSKALQKHEFLTFKEQQLKKNTDFVSQYQTKKDQQNEIVKKYIEQRNLLRHLQASNDRKMIENRLKDDKQMEEFEAKKRVEYLRSVEYYKKGNLSRTASSRMNNPTRILDLIQTFEPKTKEEENLHLNNNTNDLNNAKALLDKNSEKKLIREISENETVQTSQ